MLLASRIHNTDPAPHRCLLCQERFPTPMRRDTTSHVTKLVRRDKYVVATTHPANTILNDFRDTLTGDRAGLLMEVFNELHAIRRGDRLNHGVDQVVHADLVLSRYLNLIAAADRDKLRA